MAQNFNLEVIPKIKTVIANFDESLYGQLRSGIEAAAEVADETGSPKLKNSCEAAREATESLIKVFQSLGEASEKYCQEAETKGRALGFDV